MAHPSSGSICLFGLFIGGWWERGLLWPILFFFYIYNTFIQSYRALYRLYFYFLFFVERLIERNNPWPYLGILCKQKSIATNSDRNIFIFTVVYLDFSVVRAFCFLIIVVVVVVVAVASLKLCHAVVFYEFANENDTPSGLYFWAKRKTT